MRYIVKKLTNKKQQWYCL